jgi:hypothetical protein
MLGHGILPGATKAALLSIRAPAPKAKVDAAPVRRLDRPDILLKDCHWGDMRKLTKGRSPIELSLETAAAKVKTVAGQSDH